MTILTCKQRFDCISLHDIKSWDCTNPPDLPTLKPYPTPGIGGRFAKMKTKDELKDIRSNFSPLLRIF